MIKDSILAEIRSRREYKSDLHREPLNNNVRARRDFAGGSGAAWVSAV